MAAIYGEVKVVVDSWAWLPKSDLTITAQEALRGALTIVPRKTDQYPDEEDHGPIELFEETPTHLGLARAYFSQHQRPHHEVELRVTEGDKSSWPSPLVFTSEKRLRSEQDSAISTTLTNFRTGTLGGMVKAPPGWGKTTFACALMARMQLPTLVVVHKEFLMAQWAERLTEYLPGVQIGIAQQKRCEYEGKHVVVGMVHSLAKGNFPEEFYRWPGLVLVDECHRIGARTWAGVPARFPAKYRLGLSATPRRKDGAEKVFQYHLGPVLFTAREQRLKPTIKRVYSNFKLVRTPTFNPRLAPESLVLRFLCANDTRNRRIVELMVEAAKAGRKLLVLSKRINHLERLEAMLQAAWRDNGTGTPLSRGYYVGGMSEEARYQSSLCRVIFATSQFAAEGLDIPALDTLFLVTPMGDIEQAVGRILRPYEGKRDPIVVDFRDDAVTLFEGYAKNRERQYAKMT